MRKFPVALIAGVVASLVGAVFVATPGNAARPADVFAVSFDVSGDQTRVVIDLDRDTKVVKPSVSDDGRMVMTFPRIRIDGGGRGGAGRGLVRRWLVDEANSQARLQLELDGKVTVARRFLLPPNGDSSHWRYVVDLKSDALAAPTPTEPSPGAVPGGVVTSAPAEHRPVVVIDAGHGGRDTGALGANVREKDITLAAARALKARLDASGAYDVVLTRESDAYVPLEDRVKIARRAGADLFISLHADAGAETSTRGASAYTLSEQGAERVVKVLGPADAVAASGGADSAVVSDILLDLNQRSTKDRSAAFANLLLENVGQKIPLLPRSHRDAGFVVLLAPDVPAVLLEMGFITNPKDEALLMTASGRGRVIAAVGDAIDAYFKQPVYLASR